MYTIKNWLSTPLIYFLLVILFISHMLFLSCIAEDSHITYRFAQNWAAGYGPLWNLQDLPVEGYTNFLWVAISTLIIKLDLDLFSVSILLGTLSALGSIELSRRFALRFFGCSPAMALIPCLLLAVSGPMAAWAGSGMETSLFGFMLLSACYFFAGYWHSYTRLELSLAFISILLATLLRPEGLMVFCLLLGISFIFSVQRTRQTLKDHLIPVLLYLIPFAIYFIWRLKFFGDPLPNTFYAKTGGGINQYLRGAQYLSNFSGYYLLPLIFPLFLALWEMGLPRWENKMNIESLRLLARRRAALFILFVIVSVYLSYIIYVGGDYMAMYRFLVPLLPMIYLPLAYVINSLWQTISNSKRKKNLVFVSLGLTLISTGIHSTPLEEKIFAKPSRQHGHYRGVETERWHVERLSLIGKFFDTYKRNSSESLATRAIGAIAYYADMQIHDLSGLADPIIARKKIKGMGKGWAGHEKMDLDYSFKRLPTYLMFDRMLVEKPKGLPLKKGEKTDIALLISTNYPRAKRFSEWIANNPDFIEQHYKLSSVWLNDTYNNEQGYFSFLELKNPGR